MSAIPTHVAHLRAPEAAALAAHYRDSMITEQRLCRECSTRGAFFRARNCAVAAGAKQIEARQHWKAAMGAAVVMRTFKTAADRLTAGGRLRRA